jgi:hypothetical protein
VEKITINKRTKNLTTVGKKAKNLQEAEKIAKNYLSKIKSKTTKKPTTQTKKKSDLERLFGF